MNKLQGYLVFSISGYSSNGGWNDFEFYVEDLSDLRYRVSYEKLSSDGTVFTYWYIDGVKRTRTGGRLQVVDLSTLDEVKNIEQYANEWKE